MNIDVTGRFFQVNDEVYVSLPLVNKAVNRGEPRQFLCTEMIHWDDFRRERNINDGEPRMQQLFASEQSATAPQVFTVGSDVYLSRAVGVNATLFGAPSQPYCSEMEHWDDYCAQRNVNTGTATMASMFRPFERREFTVLDTGSQKLKVYVANSVALVSYGDDKQTYCSEMEHWDDYYRAKTGQAPQPSMASLFRPE